jgi:hypothetical protein
MELLLFTILGKVSTLCMVGKNYGNNLRLATVLGMAVLLLASVAAASGIQSGLVAAAVEESSLDFEDGGSGNFIINYIYEIEIENKDNPKLELDDDTVPQGESFMANGTNFDANSTADMSIFHEQLLSLSEDGEEAERSAALLLTRSNLTISEDGEDLVIENADNETSTASGDGSVMLVTNIFPTDASSDEYEISLECESGPDGNDTSTGFDDPLTVDNSTSKQFFELTLPAGEYEQCQVVMTPSDEDDPAIESSMADLTVVAGFDSETSVASVNGTTDEDGSFMQNVTVASDAEEGRYVLMAETTNDTDDSVKRAIAPLKIIGEGETSTAGSGDDLTGGDSNGTDTNGTGSVTNPPGSTEGDNGSNGTDAPPNDTDPQGPPAPPDGNGGGDNGGGEYVDPCQDVVSDSGNVNNTITQSSSQYASNTVSDDDVINVVQRIHGTYNGTGHLNTAIAIDDSDTVSQSVNQDVVQNAVIKKCPGEPSEGGNQTNTIDMNATQLASNAYSDNTTIIIVQTIIIPKDCNTNVNAPISISDRDTVTQSVDQGIDQDGTIAYGGSGEGSNTVVQTSMQVAHNNATNDEVITINQVIIVPPDCPVEIEAPIVVEGDDNVQMSATQTAEQDAAINSGAGGVTIVSSVGGGDQTTNTIVTVASQDGQNSFSDDDTITITQNVYYVNDTTGWTEDNYEENLEQEFGNGTSGNSTDAEGNSTSPIPSNSTETELGGDNSTSPVISNSTGTGDNSTSTEDPDTMMMAAMVEEESIIVKDDSTSDDTGSEEESETFEAASFEPTVEDTGGSEESPPSPDNSTDTVSETSPPAEQETQANGSEQPPETETIEQEETPSEPVENTEDTTTEETSEQPPAETPSDPPVTEEAPPADTNTTETTEPPSDPAPVEIQETAEPSGNSTST